MEKVKKGQLLVLTETSHHTEGCGIVRIYSAKEIVKSESNKVSGGRIRVYRQNGNMNSILATRLRALQGRERLYAKARFENTRFSVYVN